MNESWRRNEWLDKAMEGRLPCPRCSGGGEVGTPDIQGEPQPPKACLACRATGYRPADGAR